MNAFFKIGIVRTVLVSLALLFVFEFWLIATTPVSTRQLIWRWLFLLAFVFLVGAAAWSVVTIHRMKLDLTVALQGLRSALTRETDESARRRHNDPHPIPKE